MSGCCAPSGPKDVFGGDDNGQTQAEIDDLKAEIQKGIPSVSHWDENEMKQRKAELAKVINYIWELPIMKVTETSLN